MNKIKLMIAALGLTSSLSAYDYTVLLYGGMVFNANDDLTYAVSGEEDIVVKNADLSTHVTTAPPYYGFRISAWDTDDTAWEFEHTHQKLYIADAELAAADPSGKLTHWEMTDGFNFFFVNKAWKLDDTYKGLVFRLGSGLVVTHPDITYDGEHRTARGNGAITYGEGYDLSGFVLQAGVQQVFDITQSWFLSLDARFTYASAWAEDEGQGLSIIENKALHLNYGVGYKF